MAGGVLVRQVLLKISADDGDTEAKLAAISAKADELARQNPELKVRIDSAAASAKMAVLRSELKGLGNDSTDTRGRLGALAGAFNSLAFGGLSGGVGQMTMFQKAMMGLNVATGLGEPLMAGLTVAVGGLFSGVVAAGAGLGVFGLVAKSVYSQASTAVQSFETAQNTTGKASATAMAQYKAELAALPPAQQQVAKSIIGMQTAWQNFVAANTAGVGKVLSQGIGLLPKVLGAMQPLLAPTEKALSGLISQLGKGMDSSGFKSFIDMLSQNTGPAITKLGDAIGHIGVGLGGIVKAFMPFAQEMLSGVDKITAAFARWGTTLSSHSGFQSLISMFQSETPLAVSTLKNLGEVIKNVVAAMTGLSTGANSKMLLQALLPLSGILASLSKNTALDRIALYALAAADAGKKLKLAFGGMSSVWGDFQKGVNLLGKFGGAAEDASIGAKVASAATKIWTGIQAAFDVVMDANPIMLVVIAIAALVAAVVLAYTHIKVFRDAVNDALHDVASAFDDARHTVAEWADDLVHDGEDVISWFEKLPGRILDALAALPGMLFRAGANAIKSLISGFESMIGAVGSAIGNIASKVAGFFGLSPAVEGPLSGGGAPEIRGAHFAAAFAAGMTAGLPQVAAAAARLAGAAAGPALASTGAGAGGGRMQIEWVGGQSDQQFMTWIKKNIRVRGGDVTNLGR